MRSLIRLYACSGLAQPKCLGEFWVTPEELVELRSNPAFMVSPPLSDIISLNNTRTTLNA